MAKRKYASMKMEDTDIKEEFIGKALSPWPFEPDLAIDIKTNLDLDCNPMDLWIKIIEQKFDRKISALDDRETKTAKRVDFFKKFALSPLFFVIVIEVIMNEQFDYGALKRIVARLDNRDCKRPFIASIGSKDLHVTNANSYEFKSQVSNLRAITELEFEEKNSKSFSFKLLLEASRSNVVGYYGSNAIDVRIHPGHVLEQLVHRDCLHHPSIVFILKFLNLFTTIVSKFALEAAAKRGNFDTFIGLLNLPFYFESAFVPSNVNTIFNDGDFFLKLCNIAAENSNTGALRFLLNIGYDINSFPDCGLELSNLVQISALLPIIEADGCYPSKAVRKDFTGEVEDHLIEIELFHDAIRQGNIEQIGVFISKYPILKYARNHKNQSALEIAYNERKTEVYEHLKIEHFLLDSRSMSLETKSAITNFQTDLLPRPKNPEDYLKQLFVCSRQTFTNDSTAKTFRFEVIRRCYEELDKFESTKLILQTLAMAERLVISFDFDSDSVIKIDPASAPSAKGICYPFGNIFVAARNLYFVNANGLNISTTVLGTIAHEMTHYAMYLVYNNECKPYFNNDPLQTVFEEIVLKYKEKIMHSSEDSFKYLVNSVFSFYPKDRWHAELIVRAVQMEISYSSQIDQCIKEYPELFTFFKTATMRNLQENLLIMKPKQLIQNANNLFRIFWEVEWLRLSVTNNSALSYLRLRNHIKCPCPQIEMKRCQMEMESRRLHHILATFEFVDFADLRSIVASAYNSPLKPWLIINCSTQYVCEGSSNVDQEDFLLKKKENFRKFVHEILHTDRIILVTDENIDASQFQVLELHSQTAQNSFYDLAPDCIKWILQGKIDFQGYKVSFKQLVEKTDTAILQEIPLNQFIRREFPAIKSTLNENNEIELIIRKFKLDDSIITMDELISRVGTQRVIIIADQAGMGKSTALRMVMKKLKSKYLSRWQVFVDLKSCTDSFRAINSCAEAEEFLKAQIRFDENYQRQLFSKHFKQENVTIFFDGFDEICPRYKETVLKLLETLKNSSNQIWVTSRLIVAEELELAMETSSFRLAPFTPEDQCDYLESIFRDDPDKRAAIPRMLGVLQQELICIPLHIKMLAVVLLDKENPLKLENISANWYPLYDRFFKQFLDDWSRRYSEEAVELLLRNVNINSLHQSFALSKTLEVDIIEELEFSQVEQQDIDVMARAGIICVACGNKYSFKHETYAEYFLCKFLIFSIFESTSSDERLKGLMVFVEILHEVKYQNVRMFFDSALTTISLKEQRSSKKSQEKFIELILLITSEQKNLEREGSLDKSNVFSILKHLIVEGRFNIIQLVVSFLEKNSKLVKEIWLSPNEEGRNHLALALSSGNDERFIRSFHEFSKLILTKDEIEREILLKPDSSGRNAFLWAARNSDSTILEYLCEIFGTSRNFKSFLMCTDRNKSNALHLAAARNSRKAVEVVWQKFGRFSSLEEKKSFFKSKNLNKKTALSLAAGLNNSLEVVEYLIEIGENILGSDIFSDFLLTVEDEDGRTVFLNSAAFGTNQCVEFLWKRIATSLGTDNLRQYLLKPDNNECTALQLAIKNNRCDVISYLWQVLGDVLGSTEMTNVLTKTTKDGETALQLAVAKNKLAEIHFMLFNYCKELPQEVFRNFLLQQKSNKANALSYAIQQNEDERVPLLVLSHMEAVCRYDDVRSLMLATKNTLLASVCQSTLENRVGLVLTIMRKYLSRQEMKNVFLDGWLKIPEIHFCLMNQDFNGIEKLWHCYQDLLERKALKKIFKKRNHFEDNVLDLAAKHKDDRTLQMIWEFVEESFSERQRRTLLSCFDNKGQNVLHKVLLERSCNNDAIKFLWEKADKLLTRRNIKSFLSARNTDGDSALYLATHPFKKPISKNLRCYIEILAEQLSVREVKNLLHNKKRSYVPLLKILSLCLFLRSFH